MDQLEVEAVVDLRPQAADGDFHHVGVVVEVHVPDQRDDLRPGDDVAVAPHQQVQQGELLGRQVDPHPAAEGPVAAGVQLQVGDPQDVLHRCLVVAAQQRADPRQQFGELERLDHEVVGAEIEAAHLVGQSAMPGEHHHPRAAAFAQAAEQVPAVDAGQVDVEDHQFVRVLQGHVQAVDAIVGAVDDVAAFGQALVQVVGSLDFIFDNKDAHVRPYIKYGFICK